MTQESDIQLPSPPRELTFLARRRAWTEPRVRFWVLAAIVLVMCGIWFIVSGLRSRAHMRWLIEHGARIEATIIAANVETVKGKLEPPDSLVELRFDWHGSEISPPPQGLPGRKEFIPVGSKIPIRVNPDDPKDWTSLDAPLPVLTHTVGGIITLPIAGIVLLWGMIRRAQFLQIWREGIAEEAIIVETRFTATAPLCRAARVTPVDEGDKRIFTVFIPPRLTNLHRGDSIHVLRRSTLSSRAVAIAWFE